jgi:hypothetical protein
MFTPFNFQEALHPVLASEGCLLMWNLCKEVNGNFDLPNLVKYPFILHATFLWKGSLKCIVDLAQTCASPPRHIEAAGHEGVYEILAHVRRTSYPKQREKGGTPPQN